MVSMDFARTARPLAAGLAAVAATGVGTGMVLESGWPPPPAEWLFAALTLAVPALGLLIAVRRPRSAYGWLLLATACCLGLGSAGAGLAVTGGPRPAIIALAPMFAVFYGLSWIFLPLLFPDGRLPSRRWRPVAWIGGLAIAVHWLGQLVIAATAGSAMAALAGPAGASGPALAGVLMSTVGQAAVVLTSMAALASLAVRWRRGARGERRQLAWMICGALLNLAGGALVAAMLITGGLPARHAVSATPPPQGADDVRAAIQSADVGVVSALLSMAGLLAIVGALPGAIAVAVVRHQLLDIRLTVRGPRLHLVFDVRPTVGEMLSELGPGLADAEPAEQLGRLAHAVRACVDARWAAITLADGTTVTAGRRDGPPALTIPAGGDLGRLECGPDQTGRLTGRDRRLLTALAVPVGLALRGAALAARLVNAQEAERRRIERNIHDGAQQQLVALIAGLELARATGAGPDTLALLREQARQALADLRELAAGIHPSALAQGGLVEAVEQRCSGLPVATTVTADPSLRAGRFPDEIEGAMYFTVSETVANALKHAEATRIDVRLSYAAGRLTAAVADDGAGFAAPGTALDRLADRLIALGGGLDVDSAPGEGTRVRAWVPAHA